MVFAEKESWQKYKMFPTFVVYPGDKNPKLWKHIWAKKDI